MAGTGRIIQPLVVHGKTLDELLFQALCHPLPELRTPMAPHTETNGKDDFKVVVPQDARNLPRPLLANL